MKMSTAWGSNKSSRKGKRTVMKTKIPWGILGLQDPDLDSPASSIEDIRRQATSMASRGLGPGTRSRSDAKHPHTHDTANSTPSTKKRRRGATE
jgi:hypothetical protein